MISKIRYGNPVPTGAVVNGTADENGKGQLGILRRRNRASDTGWRRKMRYMVSVRQTGA